VLRGNVVTGFLRSGVLAIGGVGGCANRYIVFRNAIAGLAIEKNHLTGKTGRANTSGLEITGGVGCKDSVSRNRVTGVHVSGNTIRGNDVGIRLTGGSGTTARRNSVRVVVAANDRLDRNGGPVRVRNDRAGASQNTAKVILRPMVRYAGIEVTATSARLKAIVNPRGLDTASFVTYGSSRSYGRLTPRRTIRASAGRQTILWRITGLRPGTTYHYRMIARSRGGETVGRDATFTTKKSGG
jgi:parallel beta-helix repeat protein